MSLIKLQGNASGTGAFTIAAPNSNSDRTLTLPDNTGTILTSASTSVLPKGGPAFSAYGTSAQALTANVATKLTFDSEYFDTNSNFASSRFTPTVAGYYQLSAATYINTNGVKLLLLYRNGSALFEFGRNASGTDATLSSSVVSYANGTTDYFEIYALSTVFASAGATDPTVKWFTGTLVRAD